MKAWAGNKRTIPPITNRSTIQEPVTRHELQPVVNRKKSAKIHVIRQDVQNNSHLILRFIMTSHSALSATIPCSIYFCHILRHTHSLCLQWAVVRIACECSSGYRTYGPGENKIYSPRHAPLNGVKSL